MRAMGLALGLLLPIIADAEEPRGFLDRPWGTRWSHDAITALPGCETQGETIADVEGHIARVAQTECLGYRFSDRLTVNLTLLYPDIRWHSLDQSIVVVRSLLDLRRIWGLERRTVVLLERWAEELDLRHHLRARHGAQAPVYRDMGYDSLRLPETARGLRGYQLNFTREQHGAMRAVLTKGLGAPTRESGRPEMEVLEWRGERTLATLTRDYFVVVTREYAELLEAAAAASPAERPSPASYPWYLELVEGFGWARSPAPATDRFSP